MYADAALTRRIVGLAIAVHRERGPGLLESVNFPAARLKDGLRRFVV